MLNYLKSIIKERPLQSNRVTSFLILGECADGTMVRVTLCSIDDLTSFWQKVEEKGKTFALLWWCWKKNIEFVVDLKKNTKEIKENKLQD